MHSILVIDDQPEMRLTLEMVLAAAGYQVAVAADGNEAQRTLAKTKVDLVLTDVVMPEKDGIEVAMELRKSQPDLPVIVMTGGGKLSSEVYLKMAGTLGARGLLKKPFSRDQLLDVVAQALTPRSA